MNSCASCTNQGSTSIPAGDLPDDIREMLAYGDPLNITAMNQTDASLQAPVIRRGAFSGSGSLPRSTVPQKESGGGGPGPARRKAAN